MNISYNEIEFQRARGALEGYCCKLNVSRNTRSLLVESSPPCLLLSELDGNNGQPHPQLKCCLQEGAWNVYYPGREGAWNVYANLPEVREFQQLIDELERAPLHVHWS